MILLPLLLLGFCTDSPQDNQNALARSFAYQLIEETGGYLDAENTEITADGPAVMLDVVLPRFFTFDLVRQDVRMLVRRYSDVEVLSVWERISDEAFTTTLIIGGDDVQEIVHILYSPGEPDYLILTFFDKEPTPKANERE